MANTGLQNRHSYFKKMSSDKLHLNHCMLYKFRKCQNDIQTIGNIITVYGPDLANFPFTQYRFNTFREGNFNLENAQHFGRPSLLNSVDLRTVINANTCQSFVDFRANVEIFNLYCFRHLKETYSRK